MIALTTTQQILISQIDEVPADWMITMVEPIDKLKEMYIEDIVEYGKDNQSDSTDDDSAASD